MYLSFYHYIYKYIFACRLIKLLLFILYFWNVPSALAIRVKYCLWFKAIRRMFLWNVNILRLVQDWIVRWDALKVITPNLILYNIWAFSVERRYHEHYILSFSFVKFRMLNFLTYLYIFAEIIDKFGRAIVKFLFLFLCFFVN